MTQYRLRWRMAQTMAVFLMGLCVATAEAGPQSPDRSAKSAGTTGGQAAVSAKQDADGGRSVASAGKGRDPEETTAARSKKATERGAHGVKLDRSGRARVGKASYYARRFSGRKMADGTRMDPAKPVAASKTLPLGTVAKVTNLENGESTKVTIQDRGPYVPGRIVDLSPSSARDIGITPKDGVAPVEVAPILVPTPDGGVKTGDGARGERARQASR